MTVSTCPESVSGPKLKQDDFDIIRRYIQEKFGIDLRGKQALVASRLGKKLREAGLESFRDYLNIVRQDTTGDALRSMVDALTTNHTWFFREAQHFSFLRSEILPKLKSRGNLRIWSAACSTGEEPYSIAFVLSEELGPGAFAAASVLATDVSSRVLEHARRGTYAASRFQNMPIGQMRRHLLRGSDPSDITYLVRKEIRSLVRFETLNLMEDFSRVGKFSVIFCRNVMIYFDKETQQRLICRLIAQLQPGGYLMIGHAESLNGLSHSLEYCCPATYRKPDNGQARSKERMP